MYRSKSMKHTHSSVGTSFYVPGDIRLWRPTGWPSAAVRLWLRASHVNQMVDNGNGSTCELGTHKKYYGEGGSRNFD